MENCARCNWGLTTLPGEVNVQFIVLLSLFDRTQGRLCGGKGSIDLKFHLDPAAWVLPGQDKHNGKLRSLLLGTYHIAR